MFLNTQLLIGLLTNKHPLTRKEASVALSTAPCQTIKQGLSDRLTGAVRQADRGCLPSNGYGMANEENMKHQLTSIPTAVVEAASPTGTIAGAESQRLPRGPNSGPVVLGEPLTA